jgi:catechol 2,3-dioxygenase-like lactoylglutathione lyase family enzyme
MKRPHVHVSVEDIAQSVRFYSTLFAGETGLDHLGIQAETPDELHEVYERLQQADRPVLVEGANHLLRRRTGRHQARLCEVDAGRPARQFRHFDPRRVRKVSHESPCGSVIPDFSGLALAKARSTAIASISGRSATYG